MKTLITGGTGFVGSALTKKLLEVGHEVTVISSRSHRYIQKHERLLQLVADTTQAGDWQEKISEQDVIINLAGRSVFNYWTEKYKEQIWESRIVTTRNLVAGIKEGQQGVLLSCSAAGYYGDGGEEEQLENSPGGSDFLAQVCKEWEAMAQQAEEKGMRVATMRFGVVLGKNGGAIATMKTPFKLALGGPLGSGSQWFPWIHLEDLVKAITFLMVNDTLKGAYNFTAPEMLRQKEFAAALGRSLKRPAFFPAPAGAVKLFLGEFGSSLLQGQKVYPKALLDKGFTFSYPGISGALQEIFSE